MITPGFLRRDFRIRLFALAGILVLGNFLLQGLVFRTDLTRGRIYSLSPSSRAIVERLEQPLQVKAYFTRNLQAPYNAYEQAVRDKLDEYQAFSKGMVRYEFVDPTGDEALEGEAKRFGVMPAQIDYRARGQREIKTAYLGMAFVYGDKQEVIPIVRNVNALEYEISRVLKGLTSEGEKKTIAFLLGHGEPDLVKAPNPQQGGVNPLRQALEENYLVTTVDMSQKAEIPEAVDALVVFAPTQEVPARHQFEIDQFIMSGKPVGFFMPSHVADMRQGRLQPLENGLEPLIEQYGVKLTHDLVIDRRQNGRTQFPVRQGRLTFQAQINYPLHPVATTFDRESVIVRDTEGMGLPMHQALALTDAARGRKDLNTRALISSSEFSTIKRDGALPPVDPQALKDEEAAKDEQPGPFPLAYTLEGTFPSAWADKPLPNEDGSLDGRTVVKESPSSRLLVVGGGEFVRQSGEVFLNMVDWLAQDEDLIAIRSRGESAAPLKQLEEATQRAIGMANVAGVPLLFVLFGLIRWRVRRRARTALQGD